MTGRYAPDRGDMWAPQVPEPRGRSPRPRPGRRPGQARRRWPAVAGYCALGLVCLSLAALAFLLVAPPLDAVRDRLVRDVEARTGRTLTVAGPLSVSLFPRVVVSLGGVAVLAREGAEGAPTVTVPSVDAEMSLWSLVSRRPRLDRVTFNRPTIDLAIDAEGRRSWDAVAARAAVPAPSFGAGTPPTDAAVASAPGPKASARTRRLRPLAVRVVGGAVHYRDARSGVSYEIGALDLSLTAQSPEDAVTVGGTFAWQGEPFHFSGTLPPASPREGQPAQVVLRLEGGPIEATYEGTLSLNGGISADGTLQVARLTYKDLKIGPGTLALSVDAGAAKATLRELELYGGRGQGSVTLDAGGPTPAIAASLKLEGVSVLPLLQDAAGVSWIDGRGAVTLALNGRGRSEREIVQTLQGQLQVAVAEGAVTGIDVDKTLRALQRGRLGNLAPRREDRTLFSALTGTFDLADGVARNQDLKLVSAHVQLNGGGQVELGPRRINYTLHTKIAGDGSAEPNDSAAFRIGTLEFPVGIQGPLERPEFTIKGQEGLSDAIKQIGKNFRSREVQDAIKDLLGGNSDKRVKPGELIEKLLKKE